jgi:hypothetical protein
VKDNQPGVRTVQGQFFPQLLIGVEGVDVQQIYLSRWEVQVAPGVLFETVPG